MSKIQFDNRRSVDEWIGATPDSRPPRLVVLRIFEHHKGMCHIARRKITPADKWDVEHVVALRDGGENRESNMAPALRDKHREKTSRENTERATANRKKASHLGIKKASPGGFRGHRKFNGEIVWKDLAHD
jgi:5-methylcytosine-specific restriction endonuclease McrA